MKQQSLAKESEHSLVLQCSLLLLLALRYFEFQSRDRGRPEITLS